MKSKFILEINYHQQESVTFFIKINLSFKPSLKPLPYLNNYKI